PQSETPMAKKTNPARNKTTAQAPKAKAAGKRKAAGKPATATTTTSAGRDGGAKLYALLMACDFYLPNRLPEGTYPNLAGCVRDVEHVELFLRRRLGLTDDRLVKLTSTDGGGARPKEPPERWPTYENMVSAFRKITDMAARG